MLRLDNRENARIVEMCYKTHTTLINPIIDWTTDEVWEFIKENNLPYCSLYDEGFKRLGCIGCPMGSVKMRKAEFERYPKYKNLYLKAFEKMIENHEEGGWQKVQMNGCIGTSTNKDLMSPLEIMEWWIN